MLIDHQDALNLIYAVTAVCWPPKMSEPATAVVFPIRLRHSRVCLAPIRLYYVMSLLSCCHACTAAQELVVTHSVERDHTR